MSTRSNLMKSLPIKQFDKTKLPRLPHEMWLIIMRLKKEIEDYEKGLSDEELFQRRLKQGWTIPESQQGNWIERNRKKKIDEYNRMGYYKRLLWQVGLFNNPELENWNSKRSNLSRMLDYSEYNEEKNEPRFEVLNAGSKSIKKSIKK